MSGSAAPKSILIVTTAFAPENAIGAVRLSKFAKYLIRHGHRVTVIAPELDEGTPMDPSLECAEFASLRRHRVPHSAWFRRMFKARRNQLVGGSNGALLLQRGGGRSLARSARAHALRYVHLAYTLLRNRDWERQVLRYARAHLAGERFDAVLSSNPSLGAMWAARRMRRQQVAPVWVADFRDRVNNRTNSTRLIYWFNTWVQNRILRDADRVLVVSRGMRERLSPRWADKYHTLSNGFDPDDRGMIASAAPEAAEGVRLAYTGSLHARDLTVLFSALRRLADEGSLLPGRVQFLYAGKDFRLLREQAAAAGMDSILVDCGFVERAESLRIQSQADLVVVGTWNTPEDVGVMPAKLFECFLLGRPVVGVVNGTRAGSEFRQVVEGAGAGFVYESATATPDADFDRLCAFLRERLTGGAPAGLHGDVAEYSYDRLAARLGSLL